MTRIGRAAVLVALGAGVAVPPASAGMERGSALEPGRGGLSPSGMEVLRRSFVALDPGWGKVELGRTVGAPRRLLSGVTVPDAEGFSGRALKGSYYTPSISGFRIGFSYAPTRAELGVADTAARHLIEGALSRSDRLGASRLRLTAGGGVAKVRHGVTGTPARSVVLGWQVTHRKLKVGGVLREQRDALGSPTRMVSGGLTWEVGALRVGGQIAHEMHSEGIIADLWTTGVRYTMVPGVTVSADLGNRRPDGSPDDGTRVMVGTAFAF